MVKFFMPVQKIKKRQLKRPCTHLIIGIVKVNARLLSIGTCN